MWWVCQADAGQTWVDGSANCQARVDGPGLPEAQGLSGKAAGGCGGLVIGSHICGCNMNHHPPDSMVLHIDPVCASETLLETARLFPSLLFAHRDAFKSDENVPCL